MVLLSFFFSFWYTTISLKGAPLALHHIHPTWSKNDSDCHFLFSLIFALGLQPCYRVKCQPSTKFTLLFIGLLVQLFQVFLFFSFLFFSFLFFSFLFFSFLFFTLLFFSFLYFTFLSFSFLWNLSTDRNISHYNLSIIASLVNV